MLYSAPLDDLDNSNNQSIKRNLLYMIYKAVGCLGKMKHAERIKNAKSLYDVFKQSASLLTLTYSKCSESMHWDFKNAEEWF